MCTWTSRLWGGTQACCRSAQGRGHGFRTPSARGNAALQLRLGLAVPRLGVGALACARAQQVEDQHLLAQSSARPQQRHADSVGKRTSLLGRNRGDDPGTLCDLACEGQRPVELLAVGLPRRVLSPPSRLRCAKRRTRLRARRRGAPVCRGPRSETSPGRTGRSSRRWCSSARRSSRQAAARFAFPAIEYQDVTKRATRPSELPWYSARTSVREVIRDCPIFPVCNGCRRWGHRRHVCAVLTLRVDPRHRYSPPVRGW